MIAFFYPEPPPVALQRLFYIYPVIFSPPLPINSSFPPHPFRSSSFPSILNPTALKSVVLKSLSCCPTGILIPALLTLLSSPRPPHPAFLACPSHLSSSLRTLADRTAPPSPPSAPQGTPFSALPCGCGSLQPELLPRTICRATDLYTSGRSSALKVLIISIKSNSL